MGMTAKRVIKEVFSYWDSILFVSLPLLVMIWPITSPGPEAKTAFVLVLMSVYWMTEVIPLAVTSLFPVLLFPLLGVMKSSEVAPIYMKDLMFLFMGGLLVAVAVEKSNLHTRVALRMIMLVGGKIRWLMLGFMLPTWFFSMWMSNTATTSMMMPIAMSVMEQLKNVEEDEQKMCQSENLHLQDFIEDGSETKGVLSRSQSEKGKARHKKMCKAMSLCVCYSASIGGIASLTGTAPNLVLKAQADLLFEAYGSESGVSFGSWMAFGLPTSALALVLAWCWLQIWFLGVCTTDDIPCSRKNRKQDQSVKAIVKKHYDSLGPWRFEEGAALGCLLALVLLWLTRDPKFVSGWGSIFKPKFVSDATSSILVGCALFVIPANRPPFLGGKRCEKRPALIDWETAVHGLPWGVLLLIGGGLALAEACQRSGLSSKIGSQLSALGVLPPWVIVILVTLLTATATEVTSNTATSTLLLPIIGDMALKIGVNPLYLMLPACLAASFAFMLPAATPPNAIVFGFGHLKVLDMMLAGLPVNILCALVVTLAVQTWGMPLFNLGTMPEIFLQHYNSTNMSIALDLGH